MTPEYVLYKGIRWEVLEWRESGKVDLFDRRINLWIRTSSANVKRIDHQATLFPDRPVAQTVAASEGKEETPQADQTPPHPPH